MSTLAESIAAPAPWYRSLNRQQWYTLLAANLGWAFDGYETYALILTMSTAFRQLLPPESLAQIPLYAGVTIAVTLLGWGIGGILGGILSDYLGRQRTLVYAVLAYSLVTGLSAFAWSLTSFIALRFIEGVALGSEWGTGTSMVAEMWPDKHRGKGAGLMQCGLGIGFFAASAIWLYVSTLGPNSWRYMFLLGVLPALAVGWIRRRIHEPQKWADSDRRRREAVVQLQREGNHAKAKVLTRFTLVDLFADPRLRKLTLIAVAMSTTTTLAWWGISTWVPPYISSLAAAQGLEPQRWASLAGMCYNLGGIAGYISLGFIADTAGRRTATMTWFLVSLLMTPVLFVWTKDLTLLLVVCFLNAFFTLGQYTWCSAWLPEVFPTRIRGTAISFCFNAPRFIAFLGPLVSGTLITYFGNYGRAAVIVSMIYIVGTVAAIFFPETRGQPLPE